MEKGYFHPDRGYWQTRTEPPEHVLAAYPEGTVEVPLKPVPLPGTNHEWDGTQWAEVSVPLPVPGEVTKLQLVKALRLAGLWGSVRSAIASADAETQENWDLAHLIARDDEAVSQIAGGLGVTAQDLDQIFIDAANL